MSKHAKGGVRRQSTGRLADLFEQAAETTDDVKPYGAGVPSSTQMSSTPSTAPQVSGMTPSSVSSSSTSMNASNTQVHPEESPLPSARPAAAPMATQQGTQGALRTLQQNEMRTDRFVRYQWFFIVGVLSLFVICRFLGKVDAMLARKRRKTRASSYMIGRSTFVIDDDDSAKPSLMERLFRATVLFVRKYFIMVDVLFLRVTFAELIIIAVYVSAMAILVAIDNSDLPAGLLTPFTVHGIANRAAKLALSSIPLQIALASKNNIITLITGLPGDRLVFLHRWVGRMTIILTIVHSWTKLRESHEFESVYEYRAFGAAAFTMALLILLTAQRWSMIIAYEVFTAIHIFLVIAFIGLVWAHRPKHRNWLIASLCIWGYDRIFRVLRIVINNGLWRLTSSSRRKAKPTRAVVRPLSNDTVRVEVFQPDFPSWTPGSYAYLSTPAVSYLCQAHPFTIASCPSHLRQGRKLWRCGTSPQATSSRGEILDKDGFSMDFVDGAGDERGTETTNSIGHSQGTVRTPRPNLVFIIRARAGWTRRLLELTLRGETASIPLLVDGPYPSLSPIHRCYDTVVLFAGGAGVSWSLPILMDLIDKVQRGQSLVRSVIWVWTIRHYVNYEWFYSELERLAPLATNFVDLRMHYTTNVDPETGSTGHPPFFKAGRPNISEIVHGAVSRTRGRVFIGVSGPAAPADEVRRVARSLTSPIAILRGEAKGDIHFHRELFGW